MVSVKSILETQLTLLKYVLVVYLIIYFHHYLTHQPKENPDAGLNVAELILKYGYNLEIHEVTTQDGYILTLHRLSNRHKNQTKIPILLQHGILNSAAEFVNLGPRKALSFLLADQGFDVWLGNGRGTTWSRKHVNLDPDLDRKQFWNFSFHEIGLFDLPASIDYILEETEMDQLHYLGYSQGASNFFVLASEKSEYLSKIRLVSTLAPAVFLGNSISPMAKILGTFWKFIEYGFNILDIQEIFPNNSYFAVYLRHICDENSLFVDWCLVHYSVFHGFNNEQVNRTKLSTIFSNLPAGSSSKQINHLNQLAKSGKFHKYDYGSDLNLAYYGQESPPLYNLSKATSPIAIYYGKNDWLIQPTDIEKLIGQLPNVVNNYLVPLDKFNHNDFLHASDADKLLYEEIIAQLLKY